MKKIDRSNRPHDKPKEEDQDVTDSPPNKGKEDSEEHVNPHAILR